MKGPAPVTLRAMRPGEEAEVCALVNRVFDRHVAPGFGVEGVETFRRYADPEAMRRRGTAGHRVLVAEHDGRIAGILELRGLDHIAMLFVEARGLGAGRALVERALRVCREEGPEVRRVTVHASRFAVPIYRRLGFREEGPETTRNGILYQPMAVPLGRASDEGSRS